MIVVIPKEIDDVNVVSSTIAEPDTGEVLWNATTNYALGAVVIRTTTHKKYENVLAGVDAGLPENTPTRWLEVGVTNKWAMFDTLRNTQSIGGGSVEVVMQMDKRIDSLGLLSVEANEVDVEVKSAGDVVYTANRKLTYRNVSSWYEYYFSEFLYRKNTLLTDIPPYSNLNIKITFTSVEPVKVGAISVGSKDYLGKMLYGATSDELNFSRIDREITGEAILLPRKSVPKINVSLLTEKYLVNKVRDVRRNLNAVPAIWSGLDDKQDNDLFDTLLIFGVYKKFIIDVSIPSHIGIDLEVEEL